MLYRYVFGERDAALSVMREAAQWLIDGGQALWPLEALLPENLGNPPEEYLVMLASDGDPVAALILSYEDALFWPGIPKGNSGFIHKLTVRRRYAGQGHATRIMEHAEAHCRESGIGAVRLDCDADRLPLRRFYESCGYVLQDERVINIPHVGMKAIALYRKNLL